MSASSGISVSEELVSVFSSAVEEKNVRFIQVVIKNESLIPTKTIPISSSFQNDLSKLQEILEDKTPAYVLAKLDEPAIDWLAIYYVPESAQVRDKMMYASTRSSLLKPLGSHLFTDSIFATTKDDLTAEAYTTHRKALLAPKPLSAREQELADLRAAESKTTYQGSSARTSHTQPIGFAWPPEAEDAIKALPKEGKDVLVIIQVDASEALTVTSTTSTPIEALPQALPSSDPCYAFFYWAAKNIIAYIYSCPSGSSIKHRMLYSSGFLFVYMQAKALLPPDSKLMAERKIQTSDPSELTERFIREELGIHDESAGVPVEKKAFAKPRGPGRR